MIANRIGIDAQEDLMQGVGIDLLVLFERHHLVELLQTLTEGLQLLLGVLLAIGAGIVEQVVGNVVVGPQMVVAVDALVYETCHLLMELIGLQMPICLELLATQWLTDLEVDTSLGLDDASQDAVDIFARTLDVLLRTTEVEFTSLEQVTWLPFVAHADGDDVKIVERLHHVVLSAQAEHLDDALVCSVTAIFGSAIALGYPDRRVPLGDDVTNVVGQMLRATIELLRGAATLHTEHLVRLADIDDQRRTHQVGTKGDLGGRQSVKRELILQEAGIEHNVTMIRDVEIGCTRDDILGYATACELGGGASDDLLIEGHHDPHLKLLGCLQSSHHLAHLADLLIGKYERGHQHKRIACCNALHGLGDLGWIIGTDVVEGVVNHKVL